ncbi:hypothetical protein EVAR_6436_1 [Eumeta japonica]|uniref:Uncharacterized protein n=1 Tax=Eumeta variegata TaxID=151549 RepID=A0A4C1TCP4_EUMVA|nr:hypothetical protein EVAR_6436_1 [Eumeta japonica]
MTHLKSDYGSVSSNLQSQDYGFILESLAKSVAPDKSDGAAPTRAAATISLRDDFTESPERKDKNNPSNHPGHLSGYDQYTQS